MMDTRELCAHASPGSLSSEKRQKFLKHGTLGGRY
jgi:hypothetical protein